jgi:alanyl-tRNA synthetase
LSRLYYTDPARVAFTSRVSSVSPAGDQWHVVLDETAFYPTSGGQPHDTGTLGFATVLDVVEDDEGRVVHVVDRELEPGQSVDGLVNGARRADHRQQHSGQHVLSAAFVRLHGVRTLSFHLGANASTIDLAREVSPGEIAAAEDEANRVVWEDRPVSIRFVSAEEAAALPLRKEPVRGGELRLIDIADFDLSACGGTHVSRTGEIGLVAVRGWERFKGGSRLEFVCGVRALRSLRALRDATNASTRLLSVLAEELPSTIEKLQTESRDLRRELRAMATKLAGHEAAGLVARAESLGGAAVVLHAAEGFDAAGLKVLASSIVAGPGRLAVLVTAERPAQIVVARSPDVSMDAAAILRVLTMRFGGKGGGRPDLAQGGGLDGAPDEILAAAREAVTREAPRT